MKRTISILFLIILLTSIVGCKKDDVKMQYFSIVSESISIRATTITITVNYSYPSTLKTVNGYISQSSSMNNALNATCEINKNSFVIRFNNLQANTKYYYYYDYSNGIDNIIRSEIHSLTTNEYGLPTVITNEVI